MRQFDQAQQILTSVLKVESTCPEALFLLCWMLTANLKLQQAQTVQNNSDMETSSNERHRELNAAQNVVDLQMAEECLATLKRMAFQTTDIDRDAPKIECVDSQESLNSLSTVESTQYDSTL